METSKTKFSEAINKKIISKKHNSILYSKTKYDEMVENLENGEVHKKSYWCTSKFQLVEIGKKKYITLKPVSFFLSRALHTIKQLRKLNYFIYLVRNSFDIRI